MNVKVKSSKQNLIHRTVQQTIHALVKMCTGLRNTIKRKSTSRISYNKTI